ncbi:uncharacterized protein LOC128669937 [Plodia interpunctella]|uniref:uncharacterized protein LOC128669937 n=1 Tax=Plodia interpunctella TaxID=58824 RepID=UPI002368B167|nr:uncharacterized protein LOC128669937 [Plodia interpunctella]
MDNTDKIVIDNDAGGDDAMAIFIALLNEKHFNGPKLIALTTVNGNTDENNVCQNNQRILKVAKRQEVPIYRGSKSAIVIPSPAGNHYRLDGLGDSGEMVTGLVPAKSENAVAILIDLSKKYEGNLTIITIGPVTNIGLAVALDPGFLGRLKHLYIGAGHIHSEKHPEKEFNARTDPEAYYIIARNATPEKVTIVPFSQIKDSLDFPKQWRMQVLGAIDTEIVKEQNKFEQVALKRSDRWQKLDPATVAVAIRPDLVQEYRYAKHSIHLHGDNRGIIRSDYVEKDQANVRILHSVKYQDYQEFLLEIFSKE